MQDSWERPLRVAMYSPDSVGLGHVRRLSAIAQQLSREAGEITSLIIAGCAVGPYFPLPEHADFIKLPSLEKVGAAEWKPRSLQIPQASMRSLRQGLLREAIMSFEPDILLVDHNPAGLDNELVPALEALRFSGMPCKVVLGVRDILGAPTDIRRQWEAQDVYRLLEDYYDSILIFGSEDLFPAAELYGLPETVRAKARYCGFISSLCDRQGMEVAAGGASAWQGSGPKILVAAGGGHDAFQMMEHVLHALPHVGAHVGADTLMVAGPLMRDRHFARLEELSRNLPVRLERSRPDLVRCLHEADLVITMGGYNTLMEAVCLRKPTIVIPRTAPSAEQMIRAQLFDRLGLVRTHLLGEHQPATLAGLMESKLSQPPGTRLSLQFRGLRVAARALLENVRPNQQALAEEGWQSAAMSGR